MNISSSKIIFDALDLESLLPEEQEQLMLTISNLIYERSMMQIIECMDGSAKDEFETLLVGESSEIQIEKFLRIHVPQADQIVEDTVKELTDDILQITGESQD